MDELLGTNFGPYTIVERIAEGGMGVVYKGFQESLNRYVAIKVLRRELTGDPRFIARFRREALAIAQLSHPNILLIYDANVVQSWHSIAMQYVDGGSVKDMLAEGRLPVEEAVRITAQVADALDCAHKQGIVHRDVKPANILMSRSGRPLLTDFGIAQALFEETPLTRTGSSIGTPTYMAPEQAEGQGTDGRTDVYALGIVLYEMLAGHPPFQADVPLATLYQQVNEPPVSVRQAEPEVPRWLEAVVHKALAKRPEDRYQTAGEFAEALREGRTSGLLSRKRRSVESTAADTRMSRRAPPKKSAGRWQPARIAWILLASLLIVLLATIAGGVYLVSSGTPQEATRESATQIATREPTSTPVSVAISISTPSPSSTVAPPLRASDTELPPTLAPTSSPTASRTPTAARSSTASSTPTSTPVRATPRPGVVTDFETFGTWQRGDEPNGTLTQSATQSYQGTYSGRLEYNFATRENDYVVFEQVHPIPGEPAQISAWVYGDGSGHFVNLWVKDSKGQTWQVPLGRVTHTGWQQMAGSLDVNQPWPWGHISGPDNGTIDYPVSFQAIVLDDNPDSYTGRGTLYVDEIRSSDQPTLAAAASATPSASGTVISQPYTPSPATTGLSGRIAFAAYNAGIGNYTLYTVRPDGSELNAVADYAYQPNVSPNGERIVVNCVGGGLDDLWSLKVDGTDWRHTTTHTDDRFPSWSPNSLVIGYSSSRQGDGVFRLYTRDAPVTTDVTSYVIGDYPIWADTWEIVYNGCDYGWSSGANCGLWRVISGRRPAQLTSNPADMPTDANGEEVLFLRPEGSDWNIFRMPLTGGNAVPLAGSPGNDGPASFSPNGQYVAFLSARSGTWALYTMSRAGGDVRKVIDLPHAGDYGAAPHDWTHQRISWGPLPAQPTPVPTSDNDGLLPAPRITFPIMDDTVSSTKATLVTWSWTQQLASNQGFEVRAWHTSQSTPMGVAPPTTQLQLEVHLGLTNAYLQFGEGTYYLDVVAVQISPYQILSGSAPIRVKTDPNK